MRTTLPVDSESTNAGFGVIEVIISMFLLSLMAMAFLPVLVQSLQVSRVNASVAMATQLLSADLDRARQSNPSCAARPGPVPRSEGDFIVTGIWGTCVENFPQTLSYTSTVTEVATDEVLAEAVTLILVTR